MMSNTSGRGWCSDSRTDTPSKAKLLRNLARCSEFAESRPDRGSEGKEGEGESLARASYVHTTNRTFTQRNRVVTQGDEKLTRGELTTGTN